MGLSELDGEGAAPGELDCGPCGDGAAGAEDGEPVRACSVVGDGAPEMPSTGWKASCAVRPRTAAARLGSCTPGSSTMIRRSPDRAMDGSETPSASTRRRKPRDHAALSSWQSGGRPGPDEAAFAPSAVFMLEVRFCPACRAGRCTDLLRDRCSRTQMRVRTAPEMIHGMSTIRS